MKALVAALTVVIGLAYPLVVGLGLTRFSPRSVALGLGIVLLVRLVILRKNSKVLPGGLTIGFISVGFLALDAAFNTGKLMLFVPSLINAALFGLFAQTLLYPPSLAERVARLQVKALDPEHVHYCRSVTALWCVFFLLNGGIALVLALFATLPTWTFYNGIVAYVLIAALFLTETTYRYWRFRVYTGAPWDAFFRRLFPPVDGAHE